MHLRWFNFLGKFCLNQLKYKLKNIQVESVHEKVGFLKMELKVLNQLKEQDRLRHFCTIEDKGRHKDFFYIVMTMVGKSLQVIVWPQIVDQSDQVKMKRMKSWADPL